MVTQKFSLVNKQTGDYGRFSTYIFKQRISLLSVSQGENVVFSPFCRCAENHDRVEGSYHHIGQLAGVSATELSTLR